MDRLLLDVPYVEIIEEFERMYSHVCQAFDSEVLHRRLHGQLRKMKHEGLDLESESGSEPLIPITNPYYRLQYLDKMLHETPDIEVVAYDGNGNPKMKSNRADKIKMLEMAERIFEKMFGSVHVQALHKFLLPAFECFAIDPDAKKRDHVHADTVIGEYNMLGIPFQSSSRDRPAGVNRMKEYMQYDSMQENPLMGNLGSVRFLVCHHHLRGTVHLMRNPVPHTGQETDGIPFLYAHHRAKFL